MPLKVVRRGRWFHIHGTHHGVRIRKAAGTTDLREADDVREKIERDIHAQVILGRKARVSFAEAAAAYLRRGEERFMLKVLDAFKDTPIDAITQTDLDREAVKAYPDAAPSTLNRQFYTPAIAVLRYAASEGWRDYREWARPAPPAGRTDWRTPEEIEQLLDVAPAYIADAVVILIGTMMRASEAVRLDARDVAPDGSQVTLWDTKGGYARHLKPLSRARKALKGRSGRVLRNSRGEAWHAYDAINLALKRTAQRAGCPPLSCHVLRHTGATWRYALDRDIPRLQAAGGWRSVAMAMRYTHAATPDLKKRLKKLGWSL